MFKNHFVLDSRIYSYLCRTCTSFWFLGPYVQRIKGLIRASVSRRHIHISLSILLPHILIIVFGGFLGNYLWIDGKDVQENAFIFISIIDEGDN